MKSMTMRERMLADIQGHEHDRVPFAIYEILVPPQRVLQHLRRGPIGIIHFCLFTGWSIPIATMKDKSSWRATSN